MALTAWRADSFAASMVALGDADGMVTGVTRNFDQALEEVRRVIDPAPGGRIMGMSIVLAQGRTLFIADTNVTELPEAQELVEIALEAARSVERLGVKAVSAITPSFIACSQTELVQHYRRVADVLTVPLYLYNIPARTGNTLEPETARTLAGHPNIIGIKDSAGSQESLDGFLAIARERDDFDVLVGPGSLVLHRLRNGAAGCISGLGNIAPGTLNAIHAAFISGDDTTADARRTHFSTLRKDLYALGFPPAMVKRALRSAMPEVDASRLPVCISAETDARIAAPAAEHVELRD